VIAIEQKGVLVSNPPPETRLAADSRLCAIGTSEQRKAFNALFGETRG
jgi:K+/H+ antiporter YhaU regulatory subunit KhtT